MKKFKEQVKLAIFYIYICFKRTASKRNSKNKSIFEIKDYTGESI